MKINYYSAQDNLDARWYIRVTDYIEGKRKEWKYYSGLDQKSVSERHQAAQKLVDELTEAASFGWHPKKDVEIYTDVLQYHGKSNERANTFTIRSIVNTYLDQHFIGRKRKTNEQRITKMRTFVDWCEGRKIKSLSNFTKKNSEEYVAYLVNEKKHKSATFNQDIQLMRSLFNFVKKGNPEIVNHFSEVKKQKVASKPTLPFKSHMIPVMIEWMQTNDPQLLLFVKFIYYCFIRPGELRFFIVRDVDLDNLKIHVRAEISKNGKDQFVAIPQPFVKDLLALKLHKHPENHFIFGKNNKIGDEHWSANYFYKHHEKMQEDVGIPKDYFLYCWKPTGVWTALKAGINIKELQIQLRHEDLETTAKYLKGIGLLDTTDLQTRFPEMGR